MASSPAGEAEEGAGGTVMTDDICTQLDGTADVSIHESPPLTLDETPQVPAEIEPRDPDFRTCALCGKEKPKTVFARIEDWASPEQPLCRKCRDDAKALTEEETADQKEIAALANLTHGEEVALHRQKRLLMLNALTPYKIKQASLKDLTIGLKNLFPVEQLLQEKPTQIIASGDRETLMQMLRAVREERAKRAKTIDVTPKEAK